MLGDGLESLIPSKRIDPPSSRIGADEDIEFPLPDITNGGFGAPSSAWDVLAPPPARGVMQVKSIKNDKKEEDYIFHIETDRIDLIIILRHNISINASWIANQLSS